MSGGYFTHNQYVIKEIEESLKAVIKNPPEKFKKKTINEFKIALLFLHTTHVYIQRIDWLLSGDDGEETFHERLKEDLR